MKKRGSFDGRGAPSSRRLFLVSFSPRGARAMPFHECNSREAREGRAREQIRRRMFGDFFFSLDFQIDLRLSQFRQKDASRAQHRQRQISLTFSRPSLASLLFALSLSLSPPTLPHTHRRRQGRGPPQARPRSPRRRPALRHQRLEGRLPQEAASAPTSEGSLRRREVPRLLAPPAGRFRLVLAAVQARGASGRWWRRRWCRVLR